MMTQSTPSQQESIPSKHRRALTALALAGGLVIFGFWWTYTYNGLMSDEAMIAHFKAHRAELAQLVKYFQAFDPTKPPYSWDASPEVQALKARAGVKWLSEVGPTWLPNPYSEETAKLRNKLTHEGKFGFNEMRRTASVRISLLKKRDSHGLLHGYGWIWKEYGYMPQIPKIEGGKLQHPWGVQTRWAGQAPHLVWQETIRKDSSRVLDSLDGYPPDWKRGECVYRPIEPNWFIVMCRG
ncbi:MAG: hypothetical protein ACYC2R_12955 [Burkholderiales bacterium]